MATLHNSVGNDYAFLPGGAPFSSGVIALPGYEIVRVRFARPLPVARGFDAIAAHLRGQQRPLTALCAALTAAVGAAVEGGAHGIVLSGGEKVFSAGLDVPYLLGLETRDGVGAAWTCFLDAARALAASPVPVAAAITGHSPAGGCVLALCCDYRVMADGPYRIGLNETQVGLVAPDGIQRLMRRVVGAHRAERLLVSGEMVESGEALAIGLVDELTDIDGVPARALAWLQALLQLPRWVQLLPHRSCVHLQLLSYHCPEPVPSLWQSPSAAPPGLPPPQAPQPPPRQPVQLPLAHR